LASNISATFLKVVASAIVDKYIGESARIIREMFGFAKDHQPCVIFMDEIDASESMRIHFISSETVETLTTILLCSLVFRCYTSVGGSRFSEGTSADREIQRTLMELLNQMDGFEDQGQVKMVMATNRPDVSLLLCVEF
jgi:26S proteasome regulatory subunit T4